jgi:type VI secretion system secreted protein VgrG
MIQDGLRIASVRTTLPEGELVLHSMTGQEGIGTPYRYDLELLSENPNISLSELLGQPISVQVELPGGEGTREFNGIVTHFTFVESVGRNCLYRVTVRPWLWLMSYRVRSRIFQNQTVPEVIEALFREHGFSDFENALTESYRRLEYLVQYRESDLHFVQRLMELEGIYFFFKHTGGTHTLVLADSYSAHEAAPGYETIPYYPPQASERRERDHLHRWHAVRMLRPATYAARDFNFKTPEAAVETQNRKPLDHAFNDYEVYDYPGLFIDAGESEAQSRVRIEELQAGFERVQGEGNARGLGCGGLFKLAQYPRDDQNKEYLILEAKYRVAHQEYESTESRPDAVFQVEIVAMDSHTPYRTPRVTRKPVVEGPQTATVVGKKGEEIWTDEYGRVRLHFHWDREGPANEGSACWVRVSQAWAGEKWGSMHIPRIGQEVIVSFLEGDPDRPIVTGRVYNKANMPPYDLPKNQTQSGIKSRSTKKGTPDNFNEIRFEDKKGEEELFMQAEKNMTVKVKKNQSTSVGANRSASVGADDSVSVTGNRSVTVEKKHTVTVTQADTETYKDTRTVDVKGPDKLSITNAHTGEYKAARTLTIKGPDEVTVQSGGKKNTVTGKYEHNASEEYTAIQSANVLTLKGSQAKLTNGQSTITLDGGKVTIEAPEQIELKVGGNTVTIKAAGTVELAAAMSVSLDGGQGGSLTLDPANAKLSGPMLNLSADATVQVTGAILKLN